MKKRLLTVLISVLLILASVPAFTFAQAAEGTVPFHYVALGDASATGYGMAGGAAYGKVTAGSYVAKIRDTLMSRHFDVTVDQLGMKGMRTEELRYLLDDSYTGDVYLSETFPEIRKEQQRFLDAIKGADLITYGLGSVNVGSFLIYTAFDPEGHCSDPAIKEIVKEDPDGIKSSIDTALHTEVAKISSAARSALAAMGYDIDEMIEQYGSTYIEGAAYVYYSFCKSYDESIRLIREQNPDAALVVLGLDNMLGEFSLSVKATGAVFEIGKLYEEELITKVNAHMAAAPGVSFIPTGNAERFLDEAASYNGDKNTISSQFKDYCDLYEDDLELKTAVNKKLASYNTVSKNRGLSVAYDTAAASLKDVAGIAKVDLSVNTLLYLKDLFA